MLKNLLEMDSDKEEASLKKEKTPLYMKLLDLIRPIYQLIDVDYDQMRFIVETKMKMDGRQENPIANTWNNSRSKKDKNQFFSSLWVYALISLIMLFVIFIDNYVFQFVVYFSYLFVMMLSVLIAHFSTILLDPKDQQLIGTKPVSSKTLGAAKATHIGIYLVSFAIALGGVFIGATFIYNGIAEGVLALLLTLLASIWCLLLTILIYAFVLRRFDGEKLKNIISYSQIGVSVFTIMGYHLMGDIFQLVDPETLAMELNMQWWHIFVFPLWFVAPFGILQDGWSWTFGSYLGLLVLGTAALIFLYRKNSDKIDRNLQKINSDGSSGFKRGKLSILYAGLFCFDEREKPYFHFAWQLTKNEREFKTRLYPSMASALIVPIILIWPMIIGGETTNLEELAFIAYSPYFTMLVVPMMSISLRYSKNFKAKWLFTISPEKNAAHFMRGVYKAMLTKLLFPIYLIAALMVLFVAGFSSIPILINGFLLLALVFYVDMKMNVKTFPFTQEYDAGEANQGCVATLIFVAAVFVVVLLMFLVQSFLPFSEYFFMILFLALNGWFMKKGFSTVVFSNEL